jgi:hypothetical protein
VFDGYNTTEETVASPLNFHINGSTTYCSAHARDVVFGARLNGYGNHKAGMSIYGNPEWEHKELLGALKWAIALYIPRTRTMLCSAHLPQRET